jgi:hypothetical protein
MYGHQGCPCDGPFDMFVMSESPSNKAHVRPLREYLSIFEHII